MIWFDALLIERHVPNGLLWLGTLWSAGFGISNGGIPTLDRRLPGSPAASDLSPRGFARQSAAIVQCLQVELREL